MTKPAATTTATSAIGTSVTGPTVCLTFADRAEEAINFYVGLFRNSRILELVRSDGSGAIAKGRIMHGRFELDSREFVAFDGGPTFAFSEGFSLRVTCQTQEEIDYFWTRLTEGGEEGPCGWLKDRFGVSWQVIPAELGRMLSDTASGNSAKAAEAMFKMRKLDIATLERAYRGQS
ncbi:MAG TPA: VOC family protein [Candidatus Acidoferrum sp.]|nr:VOC family protein [Candidatus Acidoferrum sp.]